MVGTLCSLVACVAMLVPPISPDDKGLVIYVVCQFINSTSLGLIFNLDKKTLATMEAELAERHSK